MLQQRYHIHFSLIWMMAKAQVAHSRYCQHCLWALCDSRGSLAVLSHARPLSNTTRSIGSHKRRSKIPFYIGIISRYHFLEDESHRPCLLWDRPIQHTTWFASFEDEGQDQWKYLGTSTLPWSSPRLIYQDQSGDLIVLITNCKINRSRHLALIITGSILSCPFRIRSVFATR